MMQIYTALKSDHREIKKILKLIDATSEEQTLKRLKHLKQLKEALIPHSRAEEQVFYDQLKRSDIKEADVLGYEGYEEHGVVDRLIEEIDATAPNHKRWTALFSVIKESLEHHIEEEESEMFEKAHKSFDRETATAMAEDFLRLKAGFLRMVKSGKTPQQKPSEIPGIAA